MRKILAIARFTLLEAARSRLFWLVLGTLALLSAASLLLRELAITDTQRIQIAFLASLLRVCSALMTATFIISTLQREFNDKVPNLILAGNVPRSHYVLGKAIGFSLTGMAIALLCALPLAMLAPASAWWPWMLSLLLESWIVTALSVFCALSLNSVTAALMLSVGFYVLAKSMAAIQLISHASLNNEALSHRYMTQALDWLALLLPRLDQYAPTAWLVNGVQDFSLAALLLQAGIYVGLITSAAMFDLYRRNL